jgi:Ca2+-binding RTX toxin-like protein
MATNILMGIVSATEGEVFARGADGKVRRLSAGDKVFEGDVIVTASGSSARITMLNGAALVVAEQQSVAMDGEVTTVAPDVTTGAIAPLDAAQAAKVIEGVAPAGLDVEALLEEEAAAAGLAGGDSGGGSSFVNLLRIVESIPGAAYDFPLNPPGTAPTLVGEAAPETAAAEEPVVPPPPPPPEEGAPTATPDAGIVANEEGASLILQSHIVYFGDTEASRSISMGMLPEGWFAEQEGNVITLYQGNEEEYTAKATATLNPDGTVTFMVLDPLDPIVNGNTLSVAHPGQPIEEESLTLSLSPDLDVTFTSNGDNVNSSHNGMGVDNNLIEFRPGRNGVDEHLYMTFSRDISSLTVEVQKGSEGDTVTWVAYNNGEPVASGEYDISSGHENQVSSFSLADTLTEGSLAGGFDRVDLGATSDAEHGKTDYRLLSITAEETVNPDDLLFSFNVTGTDSTGDSATSVLYVNLNGDPAVGGTEDADTLALTSGGVLIGGGGADNLTGSDEDDSLFGGTGADTLDGKEGSDILVGGAGGDTLIGGAGADTFVWHLADASGGPVTDTVEGFGAGDKLEIADLLSGGASVEVIAGSDTTLHITATGVDQTIILESYATDSEAALAIKAMLEAHGSFTG